MAKICRSKQTSRQRTTRDKGGHSYVKKWGQLMSKIKLQNTDSRNQIKGMNKLTVMLENFSILLFITDRRNSEK
jgi:hypothetical protein